MQGDLELLNFYEVKPDLKMEIFHLMSFLLPHCADKWRGLNDQVGSHVLESLSLLGQVQLFNPGNQAIIF
ncbi:hypothetical protein VNO77_27704 [Canavalia gladiata]|uniref:Uncharacterized protein n=1 Tax=Canavalia gladiata TaxID=3824 RepID=A0AAN9KXS4_CANGL